MNSRVPLYHSVTTPVEPKVTPPPPTLNSCQCLTVHSRATTVSFVVDKPL